MKHLALLALLVATPSAAQQARMDEPTIEWVKSAWLDNIAEVVLGQLALKHSARNDVRELGGTLVSDSMKANTVLARIADAEGVPLPSTLDTTRQDRVNRIGAHIADLYGFDRAYLDALVESQSKAVSAYEDAARLTDERVARFARSHLPALRRHLREAQRLREKLNPPSAR